MSDLKVEGEQGFYILALPPGLNDGPAGDVWHMPLRGNRPSNIAYSTKSGSCTGGSLNPPLVKDDPVSDSHAHLPVPENVSSSPGEERHSYRDSASRRQHQSLPSELSHADRDLDQTYY